MSTSTRVWVGIGGAISLFVGGYIGHVFTATQPYQLPATPVFSPREAPPQVNVYIANNGDQKQPPTVFQVPPMTAPTRWEPPEVPEPQFPSPRFNQPHLYQARFQQVQLPVYSPGELPREGSFLSPGNPMRAYRDQFPNACKPEIWNPQCQPVQDTGNWEEVSDVPERFHLSQNEQWTKVGSYLCIQHRGYYLDRPPRCWQRT